MIIAVTGSSGFVGQYLVKALMARNHKVIELDIKNGINVLDFDQLKNIQKFDVCVHLAALIFVPLSFEKPRDFYSLNIQGVINCIELCRLHQARFVFSSSYVYGNPQYLPIDELHPMEGSNPYTETKIIGETICLNYFKYFGVRSIILRPFNIYGPGQNDSFLIPMIINQAKSGKIILKDPRPKRDFVFIDDIINCYIKAIENNSITFDIFNIGYGKSHSVREIVQIVKTLVHNNLKIEFTNEKRNHEILNTVADITKVKQVLGWQPNISLFEGLKKMI